MEYCIFSRRKKNQWRQNERVKERKTVLTTGNLSFSLHKLQCIRLKYTIVCSPVCLAHYGNKLCMCIQIFKYSIYGFIGQKKNNYYNRRRMKRSVVGYLNLKSVCSFGHILVLYVCTYSGAELYTNRRLSIKRVLEEEKIGKTIAPFEQMVVDEKYRFFFVVIFILKMPRKTTGIRTELQWLNSKIERRTRNIPTAWLKF